MVTSKQTQEWSSGFGKEYTDRNMTTVEEMDILFEKRYGISRTQMDEKFVGDMDRNSKILEVGANIGNQLLCLQRMGFVNLYGIELSSYAVELAKSRTREINLIQGSALDIPFKDDYFDIVFTSGVLIHINPEELAMAMWEIYRCSKSYIWGLEYFAEEFTPIPYKQARGSLDMLWKTDFPKVFTNLHPDLCVVKWRLFRYLDNGNEDVMYLLRKREREK